MIRRRTNKEDELYHSLRWARNIFDHEGTSLGYDPAVLGSRYRPRLRSCTRTAEEELRLKKHQEKVLLFRLFKELGQAVTCTALDASCSVLYFLSWANGIDTVTQDQEARMHLYGKVIQK